MASQWEIKINRPQRAEARKHALSKYPLQATPYLWGEGTPDEHIVDEYKEHPEYRREYLHQLKLIRARRFLGNIRHAKRSAEKIQGCY